MAAEKKRSFLLYCDLKPQIDMLSYEEKGRLLEAIYEYECGGEVKELPPMAEIVFLGITPHLDRNGEKWEETRKKRAEAGVKSGEARRDKNKQNEQVLNFVEQKGTKQTVNVNDSVNENVSVNANENVSVNVNDNDNVNVNENESEAALMRLLHTPEEIAEHERKKAESEKMFRNAFGREPCGKEKELALWLYSTTDEEILDHAYEQAVLNNRMTLAYVQGVIKNLKSLGVTDMQKMYEYDKKMGNI